MSDNRRAVFVLIEHRSDGCQKFVFSRLTGNANGIRTAAIRRFNEVENGAAEILRLRSGHNQSVVGVQAHCNAVVVVFGQIQVNPFAFLKGERVPVDV